MTFDTDTASAGNQSTLDFTTSNWSTPQTVTVSAAQDADKTNDTAEITLTSPGLASKSLTVTVMDDEDADVGLILSLESSAEVVRIDEGNPVSQTLMVKLAAQPGNDRTLTLQSVYSQVTLSPSELQFTTANWDTYQQFGITAERDDDSINAADLIRLDGPGVTARTITLSIIDYDGRAENSLILSGTSLTLDEGAGETFTVKLAAQVQTDRTITLTSDNSAVTVTPGALNFTGGNWSAPQTVTVAAAEDSDRLNTSATISLAGFRVSDASVAVTVLDDEDEDVGLTLSLKSLAVPLEVEEGGSTALTVRLASQPANDRMVTLESPDSAVTFSPASLRFTPDNWDEPQELRIIAGQDDDTENNVARAVLGGIGVIGRTIPLIIYDDDKAEISLAVSAASLTLDEGDKGTFTVRLSTEPESGRAVLLESTSPDVTVSPGVLSFGTSDWDAPRTVTVTTVQDSDSLNISATINLTGFRVADASVAVTVLDDEDEDVGLTLSLKSLAVPLGVEEGSSTALTVRLASRPANGRTVSLQSPDSVVTFSPASLQFTPDNWDEPQGLRIIVGQDDDSDNNISRATFAGTGVIARTIPLIIYDDDRVEIGLTVSAASLTLDEGDTGTFTVRLSNEPEGDRAVLLKSTNPDVTVSPATAGFSSQNWNIPQTITITAGHDDDTANDSATINLTGGGVTSASLAVTVNDDDVELTLSSSSLTVDEGSTKTFTVKLAAQPDGNRMVNLASSNPDVTVSPAALDFTSTSWNSAQTVTISAAHDDDTANGSATINLAGEGVLAGSVTVTVIDDDVELVLSATSLTMQELSSTDLGVRLSKQPTANVTVTVAQPANTDVTVDTDLATAGRQNTLTFTALNWSANQYVRVEAGSDADDSDDHATISLTAAGGGYDAVTGSVAVTVLDDNILELSDSSLTIGEGTMGSFTVRLSAQPSANVTVLLSQYVSNPDVTLDTDASTAGNQNTLTFTASNWNVDQTVRVSAADDADRNDEQGVFKVSLPSGASKLLWVNVLDNEIGLKLSHTALTIDEGLLPYRITVRMDAPIIDNQYSRVIALSSANPHLTFDPEKLYFDNENWDMPQYVDIDAANDEDSTDDNSTISLTGAGVAAGSLLVTVMDVIDLTLSTASLTINEGGTETFTIKLNAQPSSNRTIWLGTFSESNVNISPNQLTFTGGSGGNWNTPQTVTVSAPQDDDGFDEHPFVTIASRDLILPIDLAVSVIDDDVPNVGLALSSTSITVRENDSKSFSVRLAMQPTADVTVTVAQPTNTDVTVDNDWRTAGNQNILTFTTSNWKSWQSVRVVAKRDADDANDHATLSLTAAGGGYDGVTGSVAVTVLDRDFIQLSTSRLELVEGGTGSFTVQLGAQPSENVTVTLRTYSSSVAYDTDASTAGNQNTLTFTPLNWNEPQTVRVNVGTDSNRQDNSGGIYFYLNGGPENPSDAPKSLSVRMLDEDVGLTLSTESLTLNEGGTGTFTVKIRANERIWHDREITLASTNPDVTFTPAKLNFISSSNWDTPQTVTVRAAEDDDSTSDTAVISLGGFVGQTASMPVLVVDNDNGIGLTLSETSLTLNEGGTGSFTVKLNAQPEDNRTVTLSSTNTDVTFNPTELTFTGGSDGNWNTAQTVTLAAAQDYDPMDDSAVINLIGSGIDNISSVDVLVIDDDGDKFRLDLPSTSISVSRSTPTLISIRLTTQPTANVTVTLTSANRIRFGSSLNSLDRGQYSKTLTFTPLNWDSYQTVFVVPRPHSTATNATISLTAAGGGYDSVTGSIAVTVSGSGNLLGVPSSLSIVEGTTGSFKVRLTAQLTEDSVVTLSQYGSNPDVTLDTDAATAGNQNTLTFTTSNWNVAQTVWVSVANDADHADEWANIQVSLPNGAHRYVRTNIYDNDMRLDLSDTSLTLEEGGAVTFSVNSPSYIFHHRTVTLESNNPEVTLNPDEISGTTPEGYLFGTVTISAAEDDDSTNDTATITVKEYAGYVGGSRGSLINTRSITVKVTDNDAAGAGFNISAIEPIVRDGGSGLFTVRLDSRPVNGKLTGSILGGHDEMSGALHGVSPVPESDELSSGHKVAGPGFNDVGMSVPSDNDNTALHSAQPEHRPRRNSNDGLAQQFDRRRPEDQPHRLPRDRHVSHGFDYRRRYLTASA